jgi:hypothetical protein
MKMRKTLFVTAAVTMILGFLVVVPVHAQVTFDSWVGQWYKGAIMDKGVIVDDLGTYRVVQKVPTYGYVQCWDGATSTYTSWLIQFDTESGTWMDAIPYTVQVIGGTPLDYVSYGFIPPGTLPEIEIFALILSVKGKEKAGVLRNFKASSVGGCVIYNLGAGPNGTMYFPANESIKMRGISADKVPEEVQQKIAALPPCP